jgi:hypothetical protein
VRKIRVPHADALGELDLARRFVYLDPEQGARWKDDLERYVRRGRDQLGLQRREVRGFRGAAAGEFNNVKRTLGYTEAEARHELAMWLRHNPRRTQVTYAYVPRRLFR